MKISEIAIFESNKEKLPSVKTPTVEELAKKYDMDVEEVEKRVDAGTKEEMEEHTKDEALAREMALDHLGMDIDYYFSDEKCDCENTEGDKEADERDESEDDEMEPEDR